MSDPAIDTAGAADELVRAADYRSPIATFTSVHGDLSVDDAYEIQVTAMTELVRRNDPIVGAKVTVHQRRPVFALYRRSTVMGTFEVADLSRLIQPAAQAVLVFRLLREVSGSEVDEALIEDVTETVVAGIEVVDFRLGPAEARRHADVVADNAGIAKLMIGEHGVDISHGSGILNNLSPRFVVDGHEVARPRDKITSPVSAVAALAAHLGSQGGKLEKGWFVVVGPLSEPVPLHVGAKAEVHIEGMAPVVLRSR